MLHEDAWQVQDVPLEAAFVGERRPVALVRHHVKEHVAKVSEDLLNLVETEERRLAVVGRLQGEDKGTQGQGGVLARRLPDGHVPALVAARVTLVVADEGVQEEASQLGVAGTGAQVDNAVQLDVWVPRVVGHTAASDLEKKAQVCDCYLLFKRPLQVVVLSNS